MKYIQKPIVIEAVRWVGNNFSEVFSFCIDSYWEGSFPPGIDTGVLMIKTLDGDCVASYGDYIVKEISGSFRPLKADIFSSTYDQVQE